MAETVQTKSIEALQARIERNQAHIKGKRIKRAQVRRMAQERAKEKPPKLSNDALTKEFLYITEGI